MVPGVFTFYFPHPLEQAAERIRHLGFGCVQLNTAFPDWELTPSSGAAELRRVREAFTGRGLPIVALSGYRNLVAPDPERRRRNLDWLRFLLSRANELGTPFVATEAGSRHPEDDWAPCPENDDPAAFRLLVDTVGELREEARRHGATLLVEPGVGTMLDRPEKARRLFDAVEGSGGPGGEGLGLIADWANFLDGGNLADSLAVLESMRPLLAGRTKLAHIKDACFLQGAPRERHHHAADPALYGGVEYPGPGLGVLDQTAYLRLLREVGYDGPVILEHLQESDMAPALQVVRCALSAPLAAAPARVEPC